MFKILLQNIFGKKISFALILLTVFILCLILSGPGKIVFRPDELSGEALPSYTQSGEYEYILSLQKSFIQVAKSIKPAVVNISTLSRDNKIKSHSSLFENKFSLEGFQGFLENITKPKQYRVNNSGSGVIYSEKGYILTNYHVIENGERFIVQLLDNRKFEGTLIGADEKTDLAVIKIKSYRSLPKAPLGSSERLQVGQWVVAIGNPFGLDRTVTTGVISAKGRSGLGINSYENFIQTDASINPGNSGGPLLDLEGRVVGINTAFMGQGTGVGFAIPIDTAKLISDELVKKGEVERGWIGAGIQSLTPELAKTFNSISQNGALVNKIIPEALAARGGLKQGDIIIMFNDSSVTSPKELQKMVAFSKIGKMVNLKILRNGEVKTIKIKILKMNS